ncbi:MAG: T9SS type A sorting domain-containing protein [Bacteroidetes bacterium]|nr:MAG: T9SS type A sorting domain-containing protein [Bacteroidota bacterium]
MAKPKLTFVNFTGHLLLVFFITLLSNTDLSSQCSLVCNNLVQVSLDQDCSMELEPDQILEGGGCPNGNLVVEIKINGAWVPGILNSSHINQTIQVRVRDLNSGNTCQGYVHVEDKLAPQLTCENVFITCAITDYSPEYLFDVLGIDAAYPIIDENCGSYTSSHIDTWTDVDCNGSFNGQSDISAYVKRVWTAVDQSGNQSSCTQYIYFQRRHVGDVLFPADVTVSCENPDTDPSNTGAPYISDFGFDFPLYPQNSYCEMNVVYADQMLPICDGSYKILRTWTVYDWCLPTTPNPPSTNPKYYIQLIKVMDNQGPVVDCPEDMTIGTNPFDCERDFNLPDVIIEDACSRIKSIKAVYTVDGVGYTVNGTLESFPGNNFWHPDTLGVLGYANNLPLGNTQMTYIVEDDCGNTSTCAFTITVEDDVPPAAICDEYTQVSLGVTGEVYVNASTFDDGSYDNCSPVYFKARRMDANGCQPNNRFYDQVKFCCEDINDTITIVFRVYDVPVPAGEVSLEYEEWHANECMVQVFVDDKLKPTCTSPANVTVSCQNFDPSLWAYGMATATDNCCIDTITATANYSLFDTVCNKGTITRTFRAYDCGGLSSQCTQRVTVTYNQNYSIKFPNDVIVTQCDGSGMYGEPTFLGEDCELLGVSHEDVIFTVVPDACYKIERTWTIINWCTYDPNSGCIAVPNPNPNSTVNHPSNLPGPTVSPANTPAPWNPTIVKINPTDPSPTNYSIFWSANANCYQYKQIIKIIDTEAPFVEDCPASPVEICDLTANDGNLWNETYWFDNVTGSHNLCEAPTDLTIVASDLCSGSNVTVRYLLFLDLDGNGTMETVVSSTNLPGFNTIFYDNAQNANYQGGTPRQFDERPVLTNQKYGFALQTTVDGNKKSASVRWNTQQQPNNYVVPELPYGKHKIKWFVSDGCGNEGFCEYTFEVKDCKKPTVVCINGLSINIMPTGMISLNDIDFLQYTEDNCTPSNKLVTAIRRSGAGTGFPTNPDGSPQKSVTFTCDDLGTQLVELWSMDLAGNADYCETYVIIQDNMGVCGPAGSNATVAGALKTEKQDGLMDANVEIVGTPPNGLPPFATFDMTDNDGVYAFANALPISSSYTLTPTKDNDPLNGVSTFDLVLINKHILGLEPLNTPYKMIAADANNSRSITTFDIVEFRKLILGLYTQLPSNSSWRFVDEAYVFPNPSNPFQDIFPETISVADVQNNQFQENFVSVKIGDVNGNAIANLQSTEDRSAGTVYFDLEDRMVQAGETVLVACSPAEALAGYQFTLQYEGLQLEAVLPGEGCTTDNFAVFAAEQTLTASVEKSAGFSLRFRATRNGELSRLLHLSSRITKAEAYKASGELFDVAFRFNGADGTIVTDTGFELLQNRPNPVRSTTEIMFNLPEASEATLTISNAEGRILKVVNGNFAKGLNTVTVNRNELSAGILFYQLDTPTHSATKKMIVVE